MAREEMSHYCFHSLRRVRRCTGRPNIFAPESQSITKSNGLSPLMAILSACLLVAGVLRHYWDIYIHRTVRGISFLFVAIDAAGDLFSLVSILYQPTFDILGMVIYGSELAFWLGICACGFFMNFCPWIKKKARAWGYRAEEESGSEKNEPATQQSQQIYLQEVPSSTSVFQTASGTTGTLRRRDTAVQEP
ncbi:conserved hypothetical protein [Histoplasma mississippiense (nom. inval.)]|uniref:conserved hypothetical protein n=1 Tax=Ajellomyces capsulatus (strain NAm1 / WU24) TaxID=2059318 RepID=UPI000157BD16|nr:conserved hypothetical protein [Histoplasma mississippiense (nom. inval.)]EDN06139.1 conserved hypothetical protein [Histoplasma mississippiense (nom. inval.)]